MAAEPICIYSHKIDPRGIVQTLRNLAPDLQVEGPEDNWSSITITVGRGALRKPATIQFNHDADYYTGDDWAQQMRGMQGYFARFPQNENTARIMLLIQSFRFGMGMVQAEPELHVDSDDDRLRYLFALVKHIDGVLFTPSSLRDANGRILLGAGQDPDPDAVMPAIYRQATEDDGVPEEEPPSPQRVAQRAFALAAVAGRALLDQEDRADPGVEQTRQRILAWVEAAGVGEELEPDEWKLLQHPLGSSPRQDVVNATWRLEGLAVVAWALGLYDPPPYDETVDPGQLLRAVGILNADQAKSIFDRAALRPEPQLEAMSVHLLGLHWRLRQFQLDHQPMDFRKFAEKNWFGSLPLDGIRLIENDLAIGDQPIARAPKNAVGKCQSILQERHLAINWLRGYGSVYSQTDIST